MMTLESFPQQHGETILKVLQGLDNAGTEISSGMVAAKFDSELPDSVGFSGEDLLEHLVRNDLVDISGDNLDSFATEGLRDVAGLPEPYEAPEDADVGELALDFARWLKREKNILPVLMNPTHDPEDSLLYCFDSETGVWNRRGTGVLQDYIGDEVPRRNSRAFRGRVHRSLFGEHHTHFDELGLEPHKIAVKDGLLDFESNTCREIKKEDRVLNRLPVSFHQMPDEYPDIWTEFLETATRNESARKTLQEFVGYSLMHWTRKHGKMLMLLGPTRTGKSTFLRVIEELLGGDENVSNQPLEDLCSGGSVGRWSPKHLEGKIANIHPDLDGDKVDRQGRAKNLTEDGESINAERKGVDQYEIEPNAKHMYAANSAPSVSNREDAFFDRFLTVRFENQVAAEERDEDLKDKLTDQEVLNGIFKWALDGMKRLERKGEFTMSLSPLATRELFSIYESGPKKFVHEMCDFKYKASEEERKSNSWKVSSMKLHELYGAWLSSRDTYKACGIGQFSQEVRELPHVGKAKVKVDGSRRKGFDGIKIKDGVTLNRLEDDRSD